MTGSTIVAASALLAALAATPLHAQESAAPDSTAADSVASPPADSAAADSLPADSAAAAGGERGVPSLDGFRKVAILYRDMAPGVPGYETAVEVHRGPERAQVLRFVTRGTPWALVVSAGGDSYTLRDFDCSGGFTEQLEAGTPLVIPDCAMPAAAAPAPAEDEDD